MVLENSSNQYRVIRLLRKGEGFQSYLCRKGEKDWIALWFDTSLTQRLFPYFLTLREEQTFEELEDVFSWKEGLVVILACTSMDQMLKDVWQDEDLSWKEKLQLAENVLTALCVREVPVGIAGDLLEQGNIGMCVDGVPGCFYDLKNPAAAAKWTMEDCIGFWRQGMERLFEKELRQGQAQELLDFCERQQRHPPKSFLEFYQRFLPVKQSLEERLRRKGLEVGSRSVQLWKRIKKKVALFRKILMVLVLLGVVLVLFTTIFQSGKTGAPAFQNIGTVTLKS